MKSFNGFNKKQKEEIREIVKSEIREALRKNAKPDINVKDEVVEAIYSVLNEKNEDLIKNIIEIEDKISKEETEKSLFAYSMKWLLYGVCVVACIFGVMSVGATVYLCFTSDFQKNIFPVIALFLIYFLLAVILVIFFKSIKYMNKNDSYNSFMFIITMIAFMITIFTTLK